MTGPSLRHTQDVELRRDPGEAEPALSLLSTLGLSATERRKALECSPDELVGTSWEQEWDAEA